MSGRATSRVKDRTDVAKLIADLDPALLSAGNYRGPRHAKVSAGYGKYIGRVGALAVTLGVGIAVASTPTVAKADDGDAGASENSPGSTGGESAGPSTSVSTRNEETQDDGKAHGGGASSGTGTDTTGTDVPTMNVGSSGGAIDSTYGTVGSPIDKHDDEHEDEHDEDAEQEATEQESGAEESTDATPAQPESPADTAVPAADEQPGPDQGAENAAENVDPVPSDESPSAGEPPAPGGAGRAADTGDEQETGEGEHVFLTAALDEDSEPAGLNSAAKFAKVQLVPSTEKPVDLVAAVMSIPGAIVDAATFAVTAILSPLLVNGPAAPPQMPLLWTVLAWVRREITHTFFNRRPIAYPQQNIQLVPGLVTGDLDAHDPNGDPLTYTVVNGPRWGTVVVNPDGTYVYTRDAAHLLSDEQDSFTVRISDSAATHLPGIFGLIQGVFETTARFFGLAQRDNLLVDVPVTMQVVPSLVAPVVVALPVADPYTLGQDPSEVGKAVISVADPDSSVLTGATVAIGLGATSGDTLHFVNTDKIKGVWDADSYTLTLTGYASAAEYQAALQSITFTASSVSTVVRTINFVATDGTFTGVPAVTTVSVLPPLVGPVIVALPMAPSYTLGRDPAAVGDAVLSLIDLDSSTLSGATVRLGAGATEGDTLLFTDTDNIKGTWDASSYTLTLTGNATVEEYEAALQSVTFTATQLGLVGRTVTFTATDGSILSIPAATVLAVLPAVNIPPTVVVSPAGGLTTVGGDPLQVGSAVLAVGDLDSDTLGGATVQIVLGGTSGDTLHFVDTDKITGSWDASSYTLTLSGDATADEYKAALQSITFTATDAGILGRTVSFIVNDGEEQSLPGLTAVVVVPDLGSLNAPPVVVVSPAVLDVATAGGDPAAVGSAVLVVADIDSDTLTGATVKIVLGGTSGDTLHFVDTDTITGSWDPSSYTLTLTGDASVAEYEAALKSITFSATNAGLLSRTLSFSVTDDQEAQSPAAITALVVTPDLSAINVAPVVVVSPGLLELATAGGDPVNLGAAVLSVTDLNSEELAGATVKIILGGTSGDTLHFVDTDKITGSWDASSYTLTLTGDASVAEYEAALKSITFSAESTGLLLSRSISFTVTDGELTSLHGLTGVVVAPDLAAVNLPPVVLVSPAVLDIATAGGDPVQVGSAVLSVADLNSGNLAGATVRIVLGGTNGDKLHFVDTDTITGSWDASSYTLTLSGNASVAEYQAALQSITFTADSAGILSRTVSFEVSDGEYTSLPGVTGVVVAPDLGAINVPPVVVVSPVVAGVATVGGDPLDVGSAVLTVRDLNNSTITGATVSILVGTEGDELHFTDIGDIKGSWDASSYTLTLSGDGTAAEYEAALQSITFTAGGPGLLLRTITFTVTDGDESLPGVTTVAVAPDLSSVNVPPVLVVSPAVLDVATAGGSPVEVGSAVLAVADLDSANLAGATVRITTGATNGDKLHFVDTDTITGSWDASSYTLTLSGNASVADYEAALQSVTFSAQDAGLLGRTISFTVSDGQYQSISGLTALVVAPDLGGLNVPPVVVVSPVVAGVATVGGDPLDVGSAVLTVRDLNNSTITGATVSILVGTEGDELHFTDIGDIKGSWDASSYTLTLSGDGTAAEYEAALQSITFTAGGAGSLVRTFTFVVNDGAESLPGVTTVVVAPDLSSVNVPPVVIVSPAVLDVATAGGDPVQVGSAVLTVADLNSAILTGATVQITTGAEAGDKLVFVDTTKIEGHWDADSHTLTLTGDATAAEYEAALKSITFTAENAGILSRVIVFTVTDGEYTSVPGATGVVVAPDLGLNLAPVVVVAPAVAAVATANGSAVNVGSSVLAVADLDSTTLTGAVVTIMTGGTNADVLGYTLVGAIEGDYADGVLTLHGPGTAAEYQQVLQSITFSTTNAGILSRTFAFEVFDDKEAASLPGVTALVVTPDLLGTGLPPVVAVLPAATVVAVENGTPVNVGSAVLGVVDLDSEMLSGAVVSIGPGGTAQDVLDFTPVGQIGGEYVGGVLTLTGPGTAAEYTQVLQSITFATTDAGILSRTLIFQVFDEQNTPSLEAVTAVLVAPDLLDVNLPPVVAVLPAVVDVATADGTPANVGSAVLGVVDLDSAMLSGAVVTITTGGKPSDELGYTLVGAIEGDYADGVLTLYGPGTAAEYTQVLQSITFSTSEAGILSRTLAFQVFDDENKQSVEVYTAVLVAPDLGLNIAPVVVVVPAVVGVATENGAPLNVGSAVLTVADLDSEMLSGAEVTISLGGTDGDELGYTLVGAIEGDYADGVLTLSGPGTAAEYQQVLRSITFSTTDAGMLSRTLTFKVFDDENEASLEVFTAFVVAPGIPSVSLPPVVLTSPLGPGYTLNQPPSALGTAVLSVSDLDSQTLTGATIAITAGGVSGDVLNFVNTDKIEGTWNAATYTLTLTGTATVEEYEAALQSITFATTNVGLVGRTVTFTVTDGVATSVPVLTIFTVDAINLPPTIGPSLIGGDLLYTRGTPATKLDSLMWVDDDSGFLSKATVAITVGRVSGDVLAFTPPAGSNITGSYNSSTGVLTLTGTATVDEYEQALRSVTFYTPAVLGLPSLARTFSVQVTDTQNASSAAILLLMTVL
ncbi:hypothetical protein MPHL43070_00230 [Mycolicibacterium phlei DSM 43070]|uniref:Ig-like domain-containing protein n=3 Tax=Mycolicibacterium phlei TaxID=1771 RepID=UPI0007772973|nr:Ig-like domain-containing protein [Mycolicibacterium phlei]KXW74419.1 hypothetical protein MPHL43070_00230 [Mycolicibacterium phlei DSM 43070]